MILANARVFCTRSEPASDIRANSNLTGFLNRTDIKTYEALADRAYTEPEWFWAEILDYAGIRFSKPYTHLRDISDGPENRFCRKF